MRKPWIIAHRGASGHSPENTLAAYERAVQLGAGFIETDLHLTRDAQFVAIHDPTLERTTNGRGSVRDFTLAELRRLTRESGSIVISWGSVYPPWTRYWILLAKTM